MRGTEAAKQWKSWKSPVTKMWVAVFVTSVLGSIIGRELWPLALAALSLSVLVWTVWREKSDPKPDK